VSAYLLPEWAQGFGQRYPNLTVTAQTATTGELLQALRGARLDLAAIEGELDDIPTHGVQIQPLREFEQYIVVGRQHPWWGRAELALAELAGQPMVMRQASSQTRLWLDAALRAHHVAPRVVAELDNLESIKRMVTLGASLTILPLYTVRAEQELGVLRALSLAGQPLRRTLRLLWCAGRPPGPIARAFVQFLGEQYPPQEYDDAE
jgi:DNA-binding transcriptional LysR family regulator